MVNQGFSDSVHGPLKKKRCDLILFFLKLQDQFYTLHSLCIFRFSEAHQPTFLLQPTQTIGKCFPLKAFHIYGHWLVTNDNIDDVNTEMLQFGYHRPTGWPAREGLVGPIHCLSYIFHFKVQQNFGERSKGAQNELGWYLQSKWKFFSVQFLSCSRKIWVHIHPHTPRHLCCHL